MGKMKEKMHQFEDLPYPSDELISEIVISCRNGMDNLTQEEEIELDLMDLEFNNYS